MKCLRPSTNTATAYRRMDIRLRREITVWQRLKHDNVVPLLGTMKFSPQASPSTGMISPWMKRGNLNSFLGGGGPIDIDARRPQLVSYPSLLV